MNDRESSILLDRYLQNQIDVATELLRLEKLKANAFYPFMDVPKVVYSEKLRAHLDLVCLLLDLGVDMSDANLSKSPYYEKSREIMSAVKQAYPTFPKYPNADEKKQAVQHED